MKRRKFLPTDTARVKWYKAMLNTKDFVKEKTQDISGVYPALLSMYGLYRRLFDKDIFTGIEIETTTACNLRCEYCPVSTHYRGDLLMDEELFKKIIDDLAAVNYRGRIHPSWFGEPLLDKRLPSLIAYAKTTVPLAEIRIFTNGELLTVDRFKTLVEAGADLFTVTQHKESMSKNMRKLFEYVEDKPDLCDRISYRKFGATTVLRNRGGLIKSPLAKGTENKCRARAYMDVNYRGDVALCCDDYFCSTVFGNAREESVVKIWNTPDFKNARDNLNKGKRVYEICKNCNMLG